MPSEFNGQKQTLKYLFTAYFQDGNKIQQTPQDVSKNNPYRSQFYDVMQYQGISPLVKFSLRQKVAFGLTANELSVDLITGKFSLNGIEFEASDQNFEKTEPLQIIYFRETRIERDVNVATQQNMGERFYVNRYFLGWQTMWKNKNYEVKIAIDGK